MHAAARTAIAVVAGAVVAFLTIAGIEALGHRTHPIPAGLDFSDRVALQAWIESLPVSALLVVVAGWIIGALLGGSVAAWIDRSHPLRAAGIVGGLVLAATIANLLLIPHPAWMPFVALPGIALASWAAGRLMRGRAARA